MTPKEIQVRDRKKSMSFSSNERSEMVIVCSILMSSDGFSSTG